MGVEAPAGDIRISWGRASAGNVLHVMQDGKSIAAHQIKADGKLLQPVPAPGSMINLELRAADGQMRAVSNPLFLGEWSADLQVRKYGETCGPEGPRSPLTSESGRAGRAASRRAG